MLMLMLLLLLIIRFTLAIISQAYQIHGEFKRFIKKQIHRKLMLRFEGEAKKVKSKICDEVALRTHIYDYNQNGKQKCGLQSG